MTLGSLNQYNSLNQSLLNNPILRNLHNSSNDLRNSKFDRISSSKLPNLKCFYFNARSLVKQLPHVKHILNSSNFDLIFISETWLTSKIFDHLIISNFSYKIVRLDRHSSRGGGVAIIIHHKLAHLIIHKSYLQTSSCLCIDILLDTHKFRAIIVYISPIFASKIDHIHKICSTISGLIDVDGPLFICGDCNLGSIDWSKYYSVNPNEQVFCDFAQSSNLTQLVHDPTLNGKTLDIILTNSPNLFSNVKVDPPVGSSDHNALKFQLSIPRYDDSNNSSSNDFNFRSPLCNYDALNCYFANLNWKSILGPSMDIDEIYNIFVKICHQAIVMYIPKLGAKRRRPYTPPHIVKLMSYRRKLWKNVRFDQVLQKYLKATQDLDFQLKKYQNYRENKVLGQKTSACRGRPDGPGPRPGPVASRR